MIEVFGIHTGPYYVHEKPKDLFKGSADPPDSISMCMGEMGKGEVGSYP